jgi:hypothetical protein
MFTVWMASAIMLGTEQGAAIEALEGGEG